MRGCFLFACPPDFFENLVVYVQRIFVGISLRVFYVILTRGV